MSWLPKKCVVVPIDFSDQSFAAVDTALQLTESASAVHAIHVTEEFSLPDPGAVWHTMAHDIRTKHVEDALRERLDGSKYADLVLHVGFGDPGQEIAELARELGAELIVMPSHGRTGLSRLLIGSVAERVVRLAHCPVLVLRE
jgi:nucleotide-binding universal stress UspA family protein